MFRYTSFLFFFFTVFTSSAQENAPDCRNALKLSGVNPEHTTGKIEGFGGVLELNPCGLLHCIKEEHNSFWYTFSPPTISTTTIEISPNKEGDIVHFMLFKADLENYCSVIESQKAIPMRTNIANKAGVKTLTEESNELFVPENGDKQNKAIKLIGGQQYYLVVDHPNAANEGHRLKIYYDSKAIIGENSTSETETIFDAPVKISVADKETGQPIEANFEITGIQKEPVVVEGENTYVFGLESFRSYTIKVNKKGYMFYAESIITSEGPKGREMKVELMPFKEGDKMTVDNIYFKGDDGELLPTSGPALQALAKFMLENPELEIEIGGHVNAERNSGKAKKLSQQRAESVYYSLVLKDVPKERMSYKGYGNTEMKFPDPKNEAESAANRRVEIKIVKK